MFRRNWFLVVVLAHLFWMISPLGSAEEVNDSRRRRALGKLKIENAHIEYDARDNPTEVLLFGADITDADLKPLLALRTVQCVILNGTKVTDDGLAHLKNLVQLKLLVITHAGVDQPFEQSKISGRGLRHLTHLKKLERLIFFESAFSPEALPLLDKFESLKEVDLCFSDVTEEQANAVRKKKPRYKIIWQTNE